MSQKTTTTTSQQYSGSVPLWNRLSYDRRNQLRRLSLYGFLAVALLVILFPLYWMVVTSIKPSDLLFNDHQNLFPLSFTLEAYEAILSDPQFLQYYLNSIIYTVGVVGLTTVTATLGGYGLTRIDIPYKRMFARGILMGYMFPAIMLSIPMFVLWRYLGWVNTYIGVILAETALALPFGLWLMWKFFQTVPESLEESARMNGATRFQAFKDIALPIAQPGIIAVSIFAYAVAWNEYTMPTVLLSDQALWPLTVGVQSFVQGYQVLWGQVMAATTLMVIPSFLFVYFLQSYILQGFRLN
ncbi:carbohydrate ABC transporter permease [Halomarina salina]|uniref:Carbohydrate ABC transporter permease n=1 Tax=Halomarina salina TaxID=1872699 RepID=A0ABD5RU28_9EURY|nr:carbohydrate ABC transporter permease [Halomarina salina]